MWNLLQSWIETGPGCRAARRRQRLDAGVAVECLESRQLLSATAGLDRGAAAEIQNAQGRAVPRIDGVAGEYVFSNEPGTLTITQDGLNIQGVISAEHDPSGTFDAAFKKAKSKTARGMGSFLFEGDEVNTPVKVTIKFRPDGEGGFFFRYHYKELKVT